MLAYIRIVVVWAVSPIALPSSKDCAYNLPRKALRVKLALPSLQINATRHATAKRPGHQPPRCGHKGRLGTICFGSLPDQGKYSARKVMRAKPCVLGISHAYCAHEALRAKLCVTVRAASRRHRRE